MPYIRQDDRAIYESGIQAFRDAFAAAGAGDGDLNYVLTSVALVWLEYHQPPYNYSLRSRVLAAFEAAKLEFYRRAMAAYEDDKIEENGDVFPEEVLS